MTNDKNSVDLEKLSNSLKVIETANNSVNDMRLSNIVLDIDTNLSKISFEHGNCFNDYKEILDSLINSTNKLKTNVSELSKGLEKTINSFSEVENVNFRKTDLLTNVTNATGESNVTRIPATTPETQEVKENNSINTVPIGLGIGAAGITGAVGMVAADSMGLIDNTKEEVPEYHEPETEIVEKIEKPQEEIEDEFVAHEVKFDDVSPYHALRDKEELDKFYDDEDN